VRKGVGISHRELKAAKPEELGWEWEIESHIEN